MSVVIEVDLCEEDASKWRFLNDIEIKLFPQRAQVELYSIAILIPENVVSTKKHL